LEDENSELEMIPTQWQLLQQKKQEIYDMEEDMANFNTEYYNIPRLMMHLKKSWQ
jgi:hypothetical protein